MNYLSVCSGIESASVAWESLGWKPAAFSEIEPYPSKVLAHRFPDVPNLGDMTKFHEWPNLNPNLLVGGTPCQAFSVAGLRKGLSDPRGNLTLTFLAMVDRYLPEWVVWENVPGVLSDRTNAFGNLLAGLGQLGYGWAYRVLDAQYFGVAQRRKRVFVVAHLGDWTRAAKVLFEPDCLLGNPAPSRETRKDVAGTIAARTQGGGRLGTDFDLAGGCIPIQEPGKRTGKSCRDSGFGLGIGDVNDPMYTLQSGAVHGVAHKQWPVEVAPTLNASFGDKQGLEDQHALNGGGLFVLGEREGDCPLFDQQESKKRLGNGNADSDPSRRFL